MSVFDIRPESLDKIVHPFYKANVYLSGEFDSDISTIKEKLKDVADAKVVDKLTKDTYVMVVGKEILSADKDVWERLAFDGFNVPIITEEKMNQICDWVFDVDTTFPKPQKNFELNYERLFVSRFSPFVHLNFSKDSNPLTKKLVYLPKEEDYGEDLAKCLEKVGVRVSWTFNPEKTNYCILSQKIVEKLAQGEKNNVIREIEYVYNSSKHSEFTCSFLILNDVVDSLTDYAKEKGDEQLAQELEKSREDIPIKRECDSLCHYTDMNALSNMLKDDKIVLRASNILYLNDNREVEEGLEIVRKHIDELSKNGNLPAEILSPKSILEDIDREAYRDFYVTSFCECDDVLPMWAMYADNAKGCSLVFDGHIIAKEFDKDNYIFVKCNYSREELVFSLKGIKSTEEMNSTPNIVCNNGNLQKKNILDAVTICLSTKHVCYKHEREWRGVCLKTIKNKEDIDFRIKNNHIIPYVEINIPKEALEKIVVGSNTDDLTLKSVQNLLRQKGYNNVKVTKSKLPYRG